MLTTTKSSGAIAEFEVLLHKGNNAENSVLAACYDWLPNRKEVVKRLNYLAGDLDEFHKTANKGTIVGRGASVLGGGALIAGLLFVPATCGLSALLTASGVAASFLGGATVIGSSLIENGKKKSACKDVQRLIDQDKIYTKKLIAILESFKTIHKHIFAIIKNTPFTDEELVEMAKRTSNHCQETDIGKIVLFAICSCISYIPPFASQLLKCLEKVGFGTKKFKDMMPTTFWNGIQDTGNSMISAQAQFSKVARIGAVVTAGVFVAIDIWAMLRAAMDMYKGSKTDAGTKCREIAKSLETEMDSITKIIEHWSEDDPDLYPC